MGRISDAFGRLAGASPDQPAPAPVGGVDPQSAELMDLYVREAPSPMLARPSEALTMTRERRRSTRRSDEARGEGGGSDQPFPQPSAGTRAAEPEPDRLIDVGELVDYIGFTCRAPLRHKRLSLFALAATLGMTAAVIVLWPRLWTVDAKLLVQRNAVMSSLVNPARTIPREAEVPTTAAEEIVLRRDNLLSIVQQTNLVDEWERTRAPLLRLKDQIFALVRPRQTSEERVDAMVGLLERNLRVATEPSGVVNFWVQWRDPRLAYEIIDNAVRNFLQDRKRSETLTITESIAILDQSVSTLETQVGQTIAELPKRRTTRPSPALADLPAFAAPSAPAIEAPGPSPEALAKLARTKATLATRQEELAKLESQRRLELAQAQASLAAALGVYTDGHPTTEGLRARVAALTRESPQEQAMRKIVEALEDDHESLTAAVLTATKQSEDAKRAADAGEPEPTPAAPLLEYVTFSGSDDNDPTGLRLKVELAQLAVVRERANAARAELMSSQAGFKYQYNTIRPPRMPRRPAGPDARGIAAAGCAASVALAVLVALAADLLGGRIVEPWQLERMVGVPDPVILSDV